MNELQLSLLPATEINNVAGYWIVTCHPCRYTHRFRTHDIANRFIINHRNNQHRGLLP
jgi:hypothetical protein